MSEFIGSRISLISKSDIRYVGTLHEINSENATVALEQVTSFGTEGRRNNPDDEIAGSDSVYEYIVFRGSDVKDLRIEEPPKESRPPPPPPQVPNDPAILGSGSRPQSQNEQQTPQQQPRHHNQPQFQQPPPYQFPPNRFGPPPGWPGPPPGGFQGYPGMPYGGPPPGGFYMPGQGFPHPPGPFPPGHPQNHYGGPGPQFNQPPQPDQRGTPQPDQPGFPPAPEEKAVPPPPGIENEPPTAPRADQAKSKTSTPTPDALAQQAPRPPVESKPDVAAALAEPSPPTPAAAARAVPTGPKSNKIVPAVPLPKGKPAATQPTTSTSQPGQEAANAIQSRTEAATAAVAAAMAKLPPPGSKPKQAADAGAGAMENLTQKVNEMRTDEKIRTSQQQGTGGYAAGHRGRGRGSNTRRGGREAQGRGIEVPNADFDFESANAKFNKQDLVKEAIVGAPANGDPATPPAPNGTPSASGGDGEATPASAAEDVVIPAPAAVASYNKSSSFFDNISSEARDREDTAETRRPSGHDMRTEERKRNLETFGLGSVDSGYRGGYRGRGRGRGGAGYRGGYRGPRGYGGASASRGRGASNTATTTTTTTTTTAAPVAQ